MHINKSARSGFSPIAIIVIIVVVAVLGFGVYRVFTAQSNKTANGTTANNQATTSTGGQNNDNFFKVPGLGVEFEVKGNIKVLAETARTCVFRRKPLSMKGVAKQQAQKTLALSIKPPSTQMT